ncbi:uroporphyrinogen-III synthase [Brucella haematophila]|uniref:uroporphyrinogen-III synthase n=1 Tax=Brucella haematophila TaxID=419474 RepID=UPI00110E6EC5|nr:uroporphyrinogen-III synthase [Brucella haematophila]KAB2698418.1 uroporphyrinogen-III synthase [Ochrobactrum sp. Kaboul]TMV05415.1 uroporphyrinogen-III synthase [Brucella haematophila]
MTGPGAAIAGRRVLLTRPEPAALLTAAKLTDAGFEPVLLPLSRTVSMAFSLPDTRFDALTVTSANAFRHAGHALPQRDMPLFAVGEGTARGAREAGFTDVVDGGGDAVRLAETMRKVLPQGARILYLAGRVRQPIFEERVSASGLDMTVCDVYDIETIDYSRDELQRRLGTQPLAAVMLYSGVAAEEFTAAMGRIAPPFTEKTRFLCISARVAAKLPAEWQANALIAEQPDEKGLFRLFSKL